MNEIKAPKFVNDRERTVFLAGSIEMGAAEKWQEKAVRLLLNTQFTVLNPRRDDWDASWEQTIENPQFREQVEWELQGIENADWVIVYFDPNTKAPITLLELGLIAGLKLKAIVVCPRGFYRKGNVDVLCRRFGISQCETLEQACNIMHTVPTY